MTTPYGFESALSLPDLEMWRRIQVDIGDGSTPIGGALRASFAQPALNTAVIWGDSYTSRNFVAGTDAYSSLQGYWTWASTLSRHRVRLLKNAGVFGEGSAAVLSRFAADVAAYSPGWVVVMAGTNDIASSVDAATIQATLASMLDKVRGIGARAILSTIPPRNALSAAQRAVQVQVNRWIRDQGRARLGVYVVDTWQALVDPATLGILASLSNDGIHPNGIGAARIGRLIAGVLNAYAPAVDLLGHSTEDPLLLSTNPYLTGTGGTLGTGITGAVATGWATGPITSVTAAASKVVRTDGLPGEWQQFAVTAGTGLTLSQNQNGVNTAWTPGTTQVYAECEFETDADFALTNSSGAFTLSVLAFNSAFAGQGSIADFTWVGGDNWAAEARPATGVLRTPVFTVPAGTNLRLVTQITFKGSGTFRIGRIALYKTA